MRVTVQIPMKGNSERVPMKNLREVAGKPLFAHLMDKLVGHVPDNWNIVVSTESEDVVAAVRSRYPDVGIHMLSDWYAKNATGNHLLSHFAAQFPDADVYIQAFVTAPNLTLESLIDLVDAISGSSKYDSATFVTEEYGWFWFNGDPVNYDPTRMDGLPRSQDAPVFKETTGAYAVRRNALFATGCRLPSPSALVPIGRKEAVDIDTMYDLQLFQMEYEQ